jgi:hypothetical protein
MSSPTRFVLLRDLAIFQLKMLLDGAKGLLLSQVALAAAVVDVLFLRHTRGRLFYKVLAFGEKADLWLNLYGAAAGARTDEDGLFGRSRAGSDTMLGKLEEMVREREPDLRAAQRAVGGAAATAAERTAAAAERLRERARAGV